MSGKIVSKRNSAGNYSLHIKDRPDLKVSVFQVHYPNDGTYWIASATFSSSDYTDPLDTKRHAVKCAIKMIEDRIEQDAATNHPNA